MSEQNRQMPPHQGQAPDHRLSELLDQNRQLQAQLQQMKGLIDSNFKKPEQQPDYNFKPEVATELEKFLQAKLKPIEEGHRNTIGMLFNELDETKFQLKYGGDEKYNKYLPKVEEVRREYENQGKWISRADALKFVYFEETGKKAQEAPAEQKPDPVFNREMGTFVDPNTGVPVRPESVQQQPQEQQWKQQSEQQWQPPKENTQWQTTVQPQQGQTTQAWQLPNQGVNQQVASAPSERAQMGQLDSGDLGSISDADLAAFETKFGDIPL